MSRDSIEQTLHQLRQSQERYDLAVSASESGIWDWNIPGDSVYYSDRIKSLLGYPPDSPWETEDEFWSRLHPDDVEAVREALRRHLEVRAAFDLDCRIQTRSGEYRWFHNRGQAMWAESGDAIRMTGAIIDITERKRIEEELVRSEERFRSLMEQSPLAISIFKPKGRIVQVNTAWMRSWGVDEAATARVLAEYNMLIDPHLEELGVLPLVEKAFAGERVVLPPIEYSGNRGVEYVGLDDIEAQTLWIQPHLYSIKNEQGAVTNVVCINMDLTDFKRAERDASEQEGRFRDLMEQSPLAIEILSPDGQILRVNDAWKRMWGATDEETEQTLAKYNMLTDEQLVALGVMELVQRAFAGEAVVLPPIEYDANLAADDAGLEDTDLRAPWIQAHLYPIKDANGQILNIVNTYMDITGIRHAERELREQKDALARVNRTTSMGQLTGSIAHELNQPLTGILSNAQAAAMMIEAGRGKPEELSEILGEIADDARRAGDVIRNLKDLYRQQPGEFHRVDINAVVLDTVQLLNSELLAHRVDMTTDCAASVAEVAGNRVQIQQVLVNLIMNAEQAMREVAPDDRRIHISTAQGAKEVAVWVEDNGPGIDPDRIGSIFEPLATWKPDGTGMGLAISHSIVGSHHGRMLAENRPEGGARVGFVLPVLEKGLPE